MCGHCIPDGIMVCPACKRDNEAYRLGEGGSPFAALGDGTFLCICGKIFSAKEGSVEPVGY
jgi:hypothetical protein